MNLWQSPPASHQPVLSTGGLKLCTVTHELNPSFTSSFSMKGCGSSVFSSRKVGINVIIMTMIMVGTHTFPLLPHRASVAFKWNYIFYFLWLLCKGKTPGKYWSVVLSGWGWATYTTAVLKVLEQEAQEGVFIRHKQGLFVAGTRTPLQCNVEGYIFSLSLSLSLSHTHTHTHTSLPILLNVLQFHPEKFREQR